MRIFLVKTGRIPSLESTILHGIPPLLLPESRDELDYLKGSLRRQYNCSPEQISSGTNLSHRLTATYLQESCGGTVVSCPELDLSDLDRQQLQTDLRAKSLRRAEQKKTAREDQRTEIVRNRRTVSTWFATLLPYGDQIVVVGTRLLEVIGGIRLPTYLATECLVGELERGQAYLLTPASPAGVLIDPTRGLNLNTGLTRSQPRQPVHKTGSD